MEPILMVFPVDSPLQFQLVVYSVSLDQLLQVSL
jgi:hypothetical protein